MTIGYKNHPSFLALVELNIIYIMRHKISSRKGPSLKLSLLTDFLLVLFYEQKLWRCQQVDPPWNQASVFSVRIAIHSPSPNWNGDWTDSLLLKNIWRALSATRGFPLNPTNRLTSRKTRRPNRRFPLWKAFLALRSHPWAKRKLPFWTNSTRRPDISAVTANSMWSILLAAVVRWLAKRWSLWTIVRALKSVKRRQSHRIIRNDHENSP